MNDNCYLLFKENTVILSLPIGSTVYCIVYSTLQHIHSLEHSLLFFLIYFIKKAFCKYFENSEKKHITFSVISNQSLNTKILIIHKYLLI